MRQTGESYFARMDEPLPFRDTDALRAQTRALGLSRLQADFVRYLALSAWLVCHPVRQIWNRPPSTHPALDSCLAAFLNRAGWPLRGTDDPALGNCWELRWEFVAARAGAAAFVRKAPSYHDRVRLEFLLAAWERVVGNSGGDAAAVDLLSQRLAESSCAFGARFALPIDLLRRAAGERQSCSAPPASAAACALSELAPRLRMLESAIWEPVGG